MLTRRALALLGAAATLSAAGGCGARQGAADPAPAASWAVAHFTPTSSVDAPRREEGCHVDVILDRAPERPFVVLGRLSASWLGRGATGLEATEAELHPLLLRAACGAGAHVVFALETSSQDHPNEHGERRRFARYLRGTAIAGAYVTPEGRVGAAPASTGRVIRIPERVERPGGSTEPSGEPPGAEAGAVWEQSIRDPWAVPSR